MGLLVHSWGAYRSYPPPPPWRSQDYQVSAMVKITKGEVTNSRQNIRCVDGAVYTISSAVPRAALVVFGKWAAAKISSLGISEALLVPVPSSKHVDFAASFAGQRLADSIVEHCGSDFIVASPCLAFTREMPKASKNEAGGRNRYALKAALKTNISLGARGKAAILVDDVVTTGSHMKACAEFLRDKGLVVDHALCVGRTVKSEHQTPLHLGPEELDPPVPNPFDF